MNEAQLLMYLLSRKKDESTIGATREEICAKLGLTDRNADYKFLNLLQGLNTSLFHLGMVTKFNLVNSHWYLAFQDKMEMKFGRSVHTLPPRISALLFTILIWCLLHYFNSATFIRSAHNTYPTQKSHWVHWFSISIVSIPFKWVY